ncbi:hypothetical protein TIFTF001_046887 [Ficus carica]|uniref:F-box domain-containing protein n=1 Tax=Ficus carica TaxID=3494 RepID=A0AA88CGY2_FICCA|nr:hypothetical protein TIFTF001_046887 [Ficus carica]
MEKQPQELLECILVRLPAKALIRCLTVSKEWCACIKSPEFRSVFFNYCLESNIHRHFLISDFSASQTEFVLNRLDDNDTIIETIGEPTQPLKDLRVATELLGHSNGLVFLLNNYPSLNHPKMALWNPTIHRYKTVSRLPIRSTLQISVPHIQCLEPVYGFGYDKAHNEFKIIRIVQFRNTKLKKFVSDIMVYSANINGWRKVRSLPLTNYIVFQRTSFCNGFVHWLAEEAFDTRNKRILAFDIESKEIAFFFFFNDNVVGVGQLNLYTFDDHLCISSKEDDNEVRMMMSYGDADLWQFLYGVDWEEERDFQHPNSIFL